MASNIIDRLWAFRNQRQHATLWGEVVGASLEALGAEVLDLVEGPLLGLTDAIAEALVRPVEDFTLGRVCCKASRLERFVAQASDPRDLLPNVPRHAAPGGI